MNLSLCAQVRLVQDDGTEVHLPAKALALLAFLSLEGGVHSRDRLSALTDPVLNAIRRPSAGRGGSPRLSHRSRPRAPDLRC